MTNVTIKETQNPTILKFEFEDFITQNESLNSKHRRGKIISSCTATILPFVKTIYISGNFIAIEKI
jgi:hypothetical protein